jgi:hypothetical protein
MRVETLKFLTVEFPILSKYVVKHVLMVLQILEVSLIGSYVII